MEVESHRVKNGSVGSIDRPWTRSDPERAEQRIHVAHCYCVPARHGATRHSTLSATDPMLRTEPTAEQVLATGTPTVAELLHHYPAPRAYAR